MTKSSTSRSFAPSARQARRLMRHKASRGAPARASRGAVKVPPPVEAQDSISRALQLTALAGAAMSAHLFSTPPAHASSKPTGPSAARIDGVASDGVRATKIFAGFQRPVVEASRGLSQVAERISSSSTTRNVALAGSVVAAGILVKGAVDEANSLAPESAEKRAVDPPQPPKIHNFTTAAPAGAPSATIPISQDSVSASPADEPAAAEAPESQVVLPSLSVAWAPASTSGAETTSKSTQVDATTRDAKRPSEDRIKPVETASKAISETAPKGSSETAPKASYSKTPLMAPSGVRPPSPSATVRAAIPSLGTAAAAKPGTAASPTASSAAPQPPQAPAGGSAPPAHSTPAPAASNKAAPAALQPIHGVPRPSAPASTDRANAAPESPKASAPAPSQAPASSAPASPELSVSAPAAVSAASSTPAPASPTMDTEEARRKLALIGKGAAGVGLMGLSTLAVFGALVAREIKTWAPEGLGEAGSVMAKYDPMNDVKKISAPRGPSTGQPEKLDALGHVLTTQVPSAKSKYDPATDLRRWSRLPPPRGLPKYDVLSEIRSFFREGLPAQTVRSKYDPWAALLSWAVPERAPAGDAMSSWGAAGSGSQGMSHARAVAPLGNSAEILRAPRGRGTTLA